MEIGTTGEMNYNEDLCRLGAPPQGGKTLPVVFQSQG